MMIFNLNLNLSEENSIWFMQVEGRRRFRILQSRDQDGWVQIPFSSFEFSHLFSDQKIYLQRVFFLIFIVHKGTG